MKHKKEDIIAVGQEVIRRNGYHSTGIAEILSACEISKGTFYNYFDNKEQFVALCIENYSAQIIKLINTYMSFSSLQPSKRLLRYFEQLIKINQKEGAMYGCLLMNIGTELGSSHELINQTIRAEFNEWVQLLSPIIVEAQNNKEITDKLSAKVIARMVYYEVFGGFMEMKITKSTKRAQHQLESMFRLLSLN